MKFDCFSWDEVKTNAEIQSGKGKLQLRCSAPSALYVTAQGVEALAGYGTEWALEVSEAVTFRLDAAKGVRAFIYRPFPETATEAEGEVYTNIDRMPHESGAMAEVTKARRMLEIEKRQMLSDIRREMAITRNAAKGKAKPKPEPVEEAEPEAQDADEGGEE